MGIKDQLNITYICSGNTCRSYMAEAITKHLLKTVYLKTQDDLLDKINILSAGTFTILKSVPRSSKDALARLNIPAIDSDPTQISGNQLRYSDLVLTMADSHRSSIIKNYRNIDQKKIFTLLAKGEIESLINEHQKAPHDRILQKVLAREVTTMIHSKEDYNSAVDASEILFGKGTTETLQKLNEKTLLNIFEGVPQSKVSVSDISQGIPAVDFLTDYTKILSSKREAREFLKNNAISINKEKITENFIVGTAQLLQEKYILVQRGKKNYHLVICR